MWFLCYSSFTRANSFPLLLIWLPPSVLLMLYINQLIFLWRYVPSALHSWAFYIHAFIHRSIICRKNDICTEHVQTLFPFSSNWYSTTIYIGSIHGWRAESVCKQHTILYKEFKHTWVLVDGREHSGFGWWERAFWNQFPSSIDGKLKWPSLNFTYLRNKS